LRNSSEGRGLVLDREALRNPEVESRAKAAYPHLAAEIHRPLPEFEAVYGTVRGYHEKLGWA
jgi:hypothetical protein